MDQPELPDLGSISYAGKVWRHVPKGANPLHTYYTSQAHVRGRWNRKRLFGCIYTGLDKDVVRAEYLKASQLKKEQTNLSETNQTARRDLVSLLVDISKVLDLKDRSVRDKLGVTVDDLTGDTPGSRERCRRISEFARRRYHHPPYGAIRAPSAAKARKYNLIIFPDRLQPDDTIDHGDDRLPLPEE